MATSVKEKVNVEQLSKYGFKAGGEYYNWSKNITEEHKGKVVPGASFDMDIYVADSGKKYVNAVNGMLEAGSVPKAEPKFNAPKTAAVYTGRKATTDDSMSKAEWAAKDVRISRQGVIQAAVQALAPIVAPDLLLAKSVELANGMLDYVNQEGLKPFCLFLNVAGALVGALAHDGLCVVLKRATCFFKLV